MRLLAFAIAVFSFLFSEVKQSEDSYGNHNGFNEIQLKRPPGYRYRKYRHSSADEHRTAEQFSWKYNLILGFCTLAAAVTAAGLTYLGFTETRSQAQSAIDANRMTVEGRRAWIGAPDFIEDKFVFKNVGQTPTDRFILDMRPIGAGDAIGPVLSICRELATRPTLPQFSAIPSANWIIDIDGVPSMLDKPGFLDTIQEGNRVRIGGCALYQTAGDPTLHRSGFEMLLSRQGGKLKLGFSYTEAAD